MVGPVLIAINHGDAILRGQVDLVCILKMGLTVLVPYVVSTCSSVAVLMNPFVSQGPKFDEKKESVPTATQQREMEENNKHRCQI